MLVNQNVQDDWGVRHALKFPRMRYELEVARRRDVLGLERLAVEHEYLAPIPRHKDRWTKSNKLKTGGPWIPAMTGGRSSPFISTQKNGRGQTIALHQDGNSGRRDIVAADAERTLLSGARNTEFPHAFAAAQEMRAWRFLHLNPAILRQPNAMTAPAKLAADGSNLPNVLARMNANDPMLLADVSRDLANYMPGTIHVEVENDPATERFVIWATGRRMDGVYRPAYFPMARLGCWSWSRSETILRMRVSFALKTPRTTFIPPA